MGCAFGGRPLRKRSAHTSRGSYDPAGRTRRLSRGAKGHRWSIGNRHAVRVMRRARVALPITWCREVTSWTAGERSDTETVTLREARGGWKRALARVPRQSPTQLPSYVNESSSICLSDSRDVHPLLCLAEASCLGHPFKNKPSKTGKHLLPQLTNTGGLMYNPKSSP